MANGIKLSENWRKYLLEFLMLFLAVFLGFLADNLRNRLAEKNRVKEYIELLVSDLESDKSKIQEAVLLNTLRKANLDTLSLLCYRFSDTTNEVNLFRYLGGVLKHPDLFTPSQRTISQLRNAGGFSLIRNAKAKDVILTYYLQGEKLKDQEQFYLDYQNKAVNATINIFNISFLRSVVQREESHDARDFNLTLIQKDKKTMTIFANKVLAFQGMVDYYTILLKAMDRQADLLINFLRKEYDLKSARK